MREHEKIAALLDPYEQLLAAVLRRAVRDAAAGCAEAHEFLQAIDMAEFIEEHRGRNKYEIRSIRH